MNHVKKHCFAYLKLAALVNKAALYNVTLLQRLSRVHTVLLCARKTRQDTNPNDQRVSNCIGQHSTHHDASCVQFDQLDTVAKLNVQINQSINQSLSFGSI
eukprot:COSAG06_NODE_4031_length_4641_cov_24.869661_2_plen_101_part_00